jgi:spore germination protein YaaH
MMRQMPKKHALLAMLLLLSACAAPPQVSRPQAIEPAPEAPIEMASQRLPQATGPEIWAYSAYWMRDAWRLYDLGAFRRLLFFDLIVGRDGRIQDRHGWPEEWDALRGKARAVGVSVDPVVSVLDKEVFSAIFSNADSRARLLAEVVAVARASGGVHLDVEIDEVVAPGEVESYHRFIAELRAALDAPPRRVITAFILGRNALYGAAELEMMDAVIVQGYDVHWRGAPKAGPPSALEGESPAAWRSAAASLSRLGVEPGKVVISTALYGYEWPTVSGEPRAATRAAADIITYAPLPSSLLPDIRINALSRAAEHGLRREAATLAPWYAFRDRDGWRQGWFDDATSLAPRLDFVANGAYRGIALFVLGYDGGALLESIQARFREGSAPARGARPATSR